MVNKRQTQIIVGVVISVLVLIGIAFALGSDIFPLSLTGDDVTSSDLSSGYPSSDDDYYFAPRWGQVECKNTGGTVAYSDNVAFSNTNDQSSVYVNCPYAIGSAKCTVDISNFKCPTDQSYDKEMQIGSGSWVPFDDNFDIHSGETPRISLRCKSSYREYPCCTKRGLTYWGNCASTCTSSYAMTYPERKIYFNAHGYAKSGWLDGTSNCKLISTASEKLKDMQEDGESLIEGVSSITYGVTKNVIVSWQKDPIVGNKITYSGKDAVCKPYDAIYEIDSFQTEGGRTYYRQGTILKSYVGSNSLCCSTDECAGNYVCEDNQCIPGAEAECELGECLQIQAGTIVKEQCIEETTDGVTSYYLEKWSCAWDATANKYCMSRSAKDQVQCCRITCDKLTTPDQNYYCDYETGCVKVGILEPCPPGSCCFAGGNYEPYDACSAAGKECCTEAFPDDQYIGKCQEDCTLVPDGDGEEEEKSVCQKECYNEHALGLFGEQNPSYQLCLGKCWFISILGYFLIGLAAFTALAVFVITYKLASIRFTKLQAVGISSLVAVILYFVTLFFWWIGLIMLIISIVLMRVQIAKALKKIVPKLPPKVPPLS